MPLVQLVERRFPKPNVVGSTPTGHVQNIKYYSLLLLFKTWQDMFVSFSSQHLEIFIFLQEV